jgi:hypothetical protein
MDELQNHEDTGQKKSADPAQREITSGLNRRAEVGSLFRLRLQRLPTSIYHIFYLLEMPKWVISFDNAEKMELPTAKAFTFLLLSYIRKNG